MQVVAGSQTPCNFDEDGADLMYPAKIRRGEEAFFTSRVFIGSIINQFYKVKHARMDKE